MSPRVTPTLTPAQYREVSIQLRVEVANIMWSLLVSPSADLTRHWRTLTPDETEDVFDRLLAAISRHASKDRVRISGPDALPHGSTRGRPR